MLALASLLQVPQVHQVLAAGFVVCRFYLDKKFSELVGCLAFGRDSNMSLSTDDHNMDTDISLESFISWATCVS